MKQFATRRADDVYQLLLGPTVPVQPVPTELSCAELYRQRIQLMRGQLDYVPTFYDDPRTRGAAFIGAVWTPGFYYLAYRAVANATRHTHSDAVGARIDALRQASAQLRCFER